MSTTRKHLEQTPLFNGISLRSGTTNAGGFSSEVKVTIGTRKSKSTVMFTTACEDLIY